MYFHICNNQNKPVISGLLTLMRPHTAYSESNKTQCFCVYMNEVEVNVELFPKWKEKFLIANAMSGNGGIPAENAYCYIVFKLGEFRDDYDFLICKDRHA